MLLVPLLVLAMSLPGCDIRPGGGTATIFRIAGKRKVIHAVLQPPPSDDGRQPIRLRFTDENTFQTNDPLPPGRYKLALRSEEGLYLGAEVDLTADRWIYNVPEPAEGGAPATTAATAAVTATVGDAGRLPPQLVVLFVGADVIVRRASHENGHVQVDAPGPGTWRVEIIAPGSPPRTWTAAAVAIDSGMTRVDLGAVNLR